MIYSIPISRVNVRSVSTKNLKTTNYAKKMLIRYIYSQYSKIYTYIVEIFIYFFISEKMWTHTST